MAKSIKFAYILRFTMDNELLKRVLTENSRIIIPGFGVFLRKEQDGALVFNPFLRRDDGKLSAILALEYGVSAEDAKVMIDEFSDRIRTVLKVKSKYFIDGLGDLVVDNNGAISFVAQIAKPTPPPVVEPVAPLATPVYAQSLSRPQTSVEPPQSPQPQRPLVQNPQSGDTFSSRPIAPPQPIAPRPIVPPPAQPQPRPQQFTSGQAKPMVAPQTPMQASSPFSRPAPVAQPMSRPTSNPAAGSVSAPVVPPPVASPRPHTTGGASRGQAPGRVNGAPSARGEASRSPRPVPKSKKSDMWLVIAIIAAAVVIVLMVIGIINSSQLAEIKL